MPLSSADRAWIRRQLAKLREDVRADSEKTLNDVLGEEARLLFLNAFHPQERGPES